MIKDGHPYTNENGWTDDGLIADLPEVVQEIVLLWIKDNIRPIKSVNYRHSSYGIKHILQHDTTIYLTNNQFKDAMMLCGYMPAAYDTLNWNFRISESSPAFTPIERRKTEQTYLHLLPVMENYYKNRPYTNKH